MEVSHPIPTLTLSHPLVESVLPLQNLQNLVLWWGQTLFQVVEFH